MDAKTAISKAREDELYLGHDDLATKTEWKVGGTGSDILTNKKTGEAAILSAVGVLTHDGNFFEPNAGFQGEGSMKDWQLAKGAVRAMAESKATALLGAVPSMADEFKQSIANLSALLSNVVPYVDQFGMMVKQGDRSFLKLTHEMFVPREGASASDLDPKALANSDDSQGVELPSEANILPAFQIENWPVSEVNIHLRDAMAKFYRVIPIPAFREGNDHPVIPSNYTTVLRGALVRVYFTVSHKVLRRKNPHSFFTATLDEIIILQVHKPTDLTPSRARLAARFLVNPPPAITNPKDKNDDGDATLSKKRRRV
ncbi:hypothetical protein FRC08_000513 [Ceratobasidium sp. 394]|nr:hypothetical protein FRC08_000513 [Ceratobasidium sp. 394]